MSTQIRVLKTDGDHAVAVARLSELMDMDPAAGAAEEAELELLALLIQSYEQTKFPPTPPDPIDAILLRMDQQRLAHKDLVPYIGSMSKVSEVLSRKRPLSLAMIRRLHAGLGIPADVLIGEGQELSVDSTVDYTKFPLAEMQERGLFGQNKRPLQSLCLSNSRDAPAVLSQPRVVIRNWRVIRTENDLHLAGFLEDGVTCRITTAITYISMPSRRVLTASGRTYELMGSPASDAAPLGVIALRVLQLALPVQQDATNEIWSAMQSAMS